MRRCEMYSGHARPCVCLSLAAFQHYCTDPGVTLRNGRECPLVVHYWAGFPIDARVSVLWQHTIARTRNVSECLYSLSSWFLFVTINDCRGKSKWTVLRICSRPPFHTPPTARHLLSCYDFAVLSLPPWRRLCETQTRQWRESPAEWPVYQIDIIKREADSTGKVTHIKKIWLVSFDEDDANGWAKVTTDEERVLLGLNLKLCIGRVVVELRMWENGACIR